jgi:hypothetical protein
MRLEYRALGILEDTELKSHFVGTFVMILNFSRIFILPYYIKAFGESFFSTVLQFQFWYRTEWRFIH